MSRPSQIVTAVKLAALNMILGYASLAFSWDYYTGLQTPAAILTGQGLGLLFTVFVYYNIYAGRNWARILLLAMVVLSGVLFLAVWWFKAGVVSAGPLHSQVVSAVSTLITLYVLWLLFMSPGRLWFRRGVAGSPELVR
jgi:hypothetical protein